MRISRQPPFSPLKSLSWHLIGVLIAAIFVSPLIWTVTMSLRPTGKPFPRSLEFIPNQLTTANYGRVFEIVAFARFTLNSVLVAAIAVPVTVAVASMAGFAMSQLPRAWRMRLIAAAFVALMVPLTAVWLPRFIFIKEVGLIDSRWSLVLPAAFGTSPFYVLLFMWTFVRLPREMFDAARVDGAEVFRLWRDLAIPLSRPTATAVAVLAFVRYWSSFIEPLLYIQSTSKKTLPMGLHALLQLDRTNWPLLMTGAVLVTAPVVLVFLFAQRAFLRDHAGTDTGLR
jgi:multiple sugar transport system permease protein